MSYAAARVGPRGLGTDLKPDTSRVSHNLTLNDTMYVWYT